MLDVKHPTTAAYHPKTNTQVELYNLAIVTRLQHYVTKNQMNRDKYVQLLSYAYSTQVHKSVIMTSFSLVLLRHPPGPTAVLQLSSLTTDIYVKTGPRRLRLILQWKIAL